MGPIPDNTHVEQWVPQGKVLPHAVAVLCLGGSGTVLGALSAGVPLVVCPLFADQSCNGSVIENARAESYSRVSPGVLEDYARGSS